MEKKLSARERIELCFLELLQEKPVSKISVTEICNRVQINRATFYKHFLDVYDLLDAIERRTLKQLEAHLLDGTQEGDTGYEEMTCRLVTYLGEMDGRFWSLFSPERGSDLASRAFEVLHHMTYPVFQKSLRDMSPQKMEMLYHYISRGFSGIISHWFRSGKKMSAQEVAQLILEFSAATINGIGI